MGVEDALILATVLEKAAATLSSSSSEGQLPGAAISKRIALSSAFKAFDLSRRERSQFVVYSSRRQGYLVKFDEPEIDSNEKFAKDTGERLDRIHAYDVEVAQRESVEEYERQLSL